MNNKYVISVAVLLAVLAALVSCTGENDVDVGDWAVVKLPNGDIVEGRAESVTRWTASLMEVRIDGVEYTVHPACVAFVEMEDGQ